MCLCRACGVGVPTPAHTRHRAAKAKRAPCGMAKAMCITRPDWPANGLFFAFSRPLAEGWPSSAGRWPRLLIGEKILDSSQFSIVVGASLREKYSIVMNYMLCCL